MVLVSLTIVISKSDSFRHERCHPRPTTDGTEDEMFTRRTACFPEYMHKPMSLLNDSILDVADEVKTAFYNICVSYFLSVCVRSVCTKS